MKKNDIATIVLVVSISLIGTYFIAKALLGEPKDNLVSSEVVTPITSDLVAPDPSIFNTNAINPTINIQIGSSANKPPFVSN